MPIRRFKTSLFSQNDPYKVMSGRYFGNIFASATGGTITTAGGYTIHSFTTTGSNLITFNGTNIPIEYLLVGGGGPAGNAAGDRCIGGGGAGGYLTGSFTTISTSNAISVGAGGVNNPRSNGGDSTAFGLTAFGGGWGADWGTGNNGGSGGGSHFQGSTTPTNSSGVVGQGNGGALGLNNSNSWWRDGGGGGAGGAGVSGGSGGTGGTGLASSITGSSVTRAGGGGGGAQNIGGGSGGSGIGGSGSSSVNGVGGNGSANTGSGGGGGSQGGAGGAGGSGIVVIRYLTVATTRGYTY